MISRKWLCLALWWQFANCNDLLQRSRAKLDRFGITATYNLPESEIRALYDLYSATGGEDWTWQASSTQWNFTSTANPCVDRWQGVNCSTAMSDGYYHVRQLTLGSCNLYGSIPGSLSNLSSLEQLSLPENKLSGLIPSTLGTIMTLKVLNLSTNTLSGPIPDSIYFLTNLSTLDLANNDIGGNLSSSLGFLTSLVSLRLDNTFIGGSFPSTINTLPVLAELSLAFTRFNGELAPLCDLISLQYLDLENNKLYGSIPQCITLLENLRVLRLGETFLTGTLPVWLNTPHLEVLSFFSSYLLSGTLPPSLGSLAHLRELDIYQCGFNGSIPNSFGGLARLQVFKVSENDLTGTIPPGLLNLPHLVEARMARNSLSGRLPNITVLASTLQLLELRQNRLTGPVPESLTNLAQLKTLDLGRNQLTGPMPALCGLNSLQTLVLERNQITGSIHDCIGALLNLTNFYAGSNQFAGSLPASLGDLPQLVLLNLSYNHLVGSIPSRFSIDLQCLVLNNNSLTGSIPELLMQLPNLGLLNLGNNLLTGEIPSIAAPLLSTIVLNSNQLRGTLPASLANLTELLSLVVYDNQLTGALDAAFNGTTQLYLNAVILNDNQFTGTLPAHLFELPSISAFAASTNCFHGTLPATICTPYFSALVLNGMSAASSCRHPLLPGLASTYTIQQGVHGEIPPCLYAGFIDTLQLSGNKFSGNLSDSMVTAPGFYVSSISLSHNALTGTIPQSFQNYEWHTLDLSFNKLTGTLSSTLMSVTPVVNNQVLYLENNRLSGAIPRTIENLTYISILGTNVFSCRLDGNDLPAHDEDRDKYHCGSDGFNVPYYVWLGMVCVVVLPVLIMIYGVKNNALVVQCRSWYEAAYPPNGADNVYLRHVLDSFHRVCAVSAWCALYAVVLLLPVYAALSHSFSTLTYSYAWSVSAAYLSGRVPIVPEIILWLLLLCSVLVLYRLFAPAPPGQDTTHAAARTAFMHRDTAVYALYLTVNTTVVMGVNVAYLYIAVYKGGGLLVMAQVLLAFFKHGWSSIVMDILLCRIIAFVNKEKKVGDVSSASYTSLSVAATIVNNVIIPCVVVSVISPSCFYNAFSQAQKVQSDYSYSICTRYLNGYCEAVEGVRGSNSYSPPYEYSYQCSSGLITYYAPAFVNWCIVCTVISPLTQVVILALYQRATPGSAWHKLLDKSLPSILKPVGSASDAKSQSLLKHGRIFLSIITYLALLLTFGVVFPPLAVALALAVLATVFYCRLRLGRFVCAARDTQQLSQYLALLEKECEVVNAPAVLWHSLWMLITLSCFFYALFLFDTLGDAVGVRGAYWVLIVMPLLPAVLYVGYSGILRYSSLHPTPMVVSDSVASPLQVSEGVELVKVGANENSLGV